MMISKLQAKGIAIISKLKTSGGDRSKPTKNDNTIKIFLFCFKKLLVKNLFFNKNKQTIGS